MMLGTGEMADTFAEPEGTIIRTLPYAGLTQSRPRFSPSASSVVLTNRGILDFRSGALLALNARRGSSVGTSWLRGGAEASFAIQPTPGKDGGGHVQLFPVAYQPAPFDDTLPLAVKTGGDCLTLRESATTESLSLACMADGTPLAFEEVTLPGRRPEEPSEQFIGLRNEEQETWLRVRAPSGQVGWVNAPFVGWQID
jgi:hypothetical protein